MAYKDQGHRLEHRFWLNQDVAKQMHLIDILREAKSRRKYHSMIRDGIRLVHDLQNGRLDVLLELFPWIMVYFEERAAQRGGNVRLAAIGDDEPVVEIRRVSEKGKGSRNFMRALGGLQ